MMINLTHKPTKVQDELLNVFILLEENNYNASKEAAEIYMRLSGLKTFSQALIEAKREYKEFTKPTHP